MPTDDIHADCSDDLWDVKTTATKLGIGERRLRDGCNSGLFPHHRATEKGVLMFCPAARREIARKTHVGAKTAMPPKPRRRVLANA